MDKFLAQDWSSEIPISNRPQIEHSQTGILLSRETARYYNSRKLKRKRKKEMFLPPQTGLILCMFPSQGLNPRKEQTSHTANPVPILIFKHPFTPFSIAMQNVRSCINLK